MGSMEGIGHPKILKILIDHWKCLRSYELSAWKHKLWSANLVMDGTRTCLCVVTHVQTLSGSKGFTMQRRVAFVTETKAALNIVDEFLCSYIFTFLEDI